MRKSILICVLSVFSFFAAFGGFSPSPTLWAQNQPPSQLRLDSYGNNVAPQLVAHIRPNTLKASYSDEICPKEFTNVTISWPTGTRNPALDALFKKIALNQFSTVFLYESGFTEDYCPDPGGDDSRFGEYVLSFEAQAPSSAILSIIWTEFSSSPTAAHPNTRYISQNFHVETGKELVLTDLFPAPEKSLPQLWRYLANQWCLFDASQTQVPYFYQVESGDCGAPDKISPPKSFQDPNSPLSVLGNPSFNPDGMLLLLSPYESWSFADGKASLNVPQDILIKLGANPNIWRQDEAIAK